MWALSIVHDPATITSGHRLSIPATYRKLATTGMIVVREGSRTSLFMLRVSPWQVSFAIGGKHTGAGRDRSLCAEVRGFSGIATAHGCTRYVRIPRAATYGSGNGLEGGVACVSSNVKSFDGRRLWQRG